MLVFVEGGKLENPEEKETWNKERSSKILNPLMSPSPGFPLHHPCSPEF